MKTTIDFKECLKDSPKFRSAVENAESDIDVLEARLERLVKLCSIMIDTGKSFKKASSDFVVGVRDLANYFHDDNLISDDNKVTNCLNKFAHEMAEMLNYFTTLMDQANRSVCKNLSNFVKKDIRKVKDAQKDFEKASSDLDNAISRNANAPKSKLQECEEAANILTAKKSCFAHTSLDYVFQINILNSKKRFDILETMLSFMHAQSTFFHQGHELFKEFEPEMKSVASQVDELSAKAIKERKEMEERHTLVQEKELIQPVDGDEDIYPMEGYLLKRTSKGFKSWVRRWFTIQNSQLSYMKRSGSREPTIMEDDLRLCTVKPMYEIDRRFCFEVLSPARSHMLQAESDQNMQAWFSNIQQAISQAYRNAERQNSVEEEEESFVSTTAENNVVTTTPQQQTKQPSKEQLRMEKLLAIPGNDKCCDCGNPDPRWSSINLGITLCIECSGIHRSFGVHLSKVRSITLDTWEPELIKVMAELGNDVVNRIYEANLDDSIAAKPSSDGKRSEREAFVRAKYIDKAFVAKLPGPKATSGKKLRGWSVRKKTKRSPTRTLEKDETNDQSDNDLDVTSGIMEAVLSVSQNTRNSEVGSVASATDVIVFGTDTELPDFSKSIDLESSEDSCSEDAEDSKSTTSWEDMSKLDPNMLLFKAAQARNLKVMLEALSNKANVNWVNEEEDDKTPLMKAVETGSLAACEFLMLNGAKLDRVDKKGRTPLHHATLHGNTGQVCQFLKRGANLHAKDGAGEDPLTIAINAANADIVTLLRLAKLNEEMKDDGAFGTTSDGTFQDVFRDFSNMASENPEKLKRKDQT